MQCPACGLQNKPGARYCSYCGAVLEEEPSTLQPGQLVDHGTYRIIRPLGKGGMGAVYLAANTKAFDRTCVVKEVIEYYDPNDPEAREKAMRRFESEARTLATLKNPGIPDIYAYFSEGGRNYLVMEYIEGPNLAQDLTRERDGKIIQGRSLPAEDVVRYAIQICEVLIYLEGLQPPVIHNDIKPANIILDRSSGRAVLVDFGTAKTRYTRQAAGQPGRQHSSVYGTVGYAAAELYDGKAEPRSDVYALAATAYHLLTDDDPRAHPFSFPHMDKVPEPLRRALSEALQADVEKRLSAEEFKGQLQEALHLLRAPQAKTAPVSSVQRKGASQQGGPVAVRIAPPIVDVLPSQVDLGPVSSRERFTDIRSFQVRNRGKSDARCRIEGAPDWLTVAPQTFVCLPGQTREISLRGRTYALPADGTRHSATLAVKVEGASRPHEVRITLETRTSESREGSRLGAVVMIGLATLVLLGALVWFLLAVLPMLGL